MTYRNSKFRAPGTGPWSTRYIRNWRDLPVKPYRLTDVLEVYLAVRQGFLRPKAEHSVKYVYEDAIRYFGDRCFTSFSRGDVITYARHLASRGLQQGGIQNHLHILHAGIKVFIREYGLEIHNPMTTFHAHELWRDETEFPILAASEIQALRAACLHDDDDIRWLLAILIDTGARPAEIAGLALSDLHLDAEIPYVEIRVQPWRDLKTVAARRRIPLIGAALWAAQRIVSDAKRSQRFAFPRQFDGTHFIERSKATLGRWLFARGFKGSLLAIRRTFVERLRISDCPEDVRAALAGWRLRGMEEEYGVGFSLLTLHRWLLRIAEPLPEPKPLKAVGYDRAMSVYECGLAVMELIRKLPYPSVQAMTREGSIARVDLRRGLNYARRYGAVEILPTVPATRSPAYRITGTALAKTAASARPRRTRQPDDPTYDYRKLLLTFAMPARLQEAACFGREVQRVPSLAVKRKPAGISPKQGLERHGEFPVEI